MELAPLADVEDRYVRHVMTAVGGNRTLAAKTLGIDRKTLYRKLKSMGYDAQSVTQGRTLYVTECVRCHSPEAVTRYSWKRWGEIIPRMAERSDLSDSETQALSAYIRTTLGQQNTSE